MHVLIVSTFFPPIIKGGAEICAEQIARALVEAGHEVSVFTSAPTPADELWDEPIGDYRMFRVSLPRAYSPANGGAASPWQKPIWHLQDHIDPRNRQQFSRVLHQVQPDLVHLHVVQGLGYNIFRTLGDHNARVVLTLHDLALACINTTMFPGGQPCRGWCRACRVSASIKQHYLSSIEDLTIVSPSAALLARVRAHVDLGDAVTHIIHNPLSFPPAARARSLDRSKLRLLYVGRLHAPKGVEVMLAALDALDRDDFTLDLFGEGPDEEALKASYERRAWASFHGQVAIERISDAMADADLLLVPSLSFENASGVIVHALAECLPVMASRIGGIPEFVDDGRTGVLVAPGDVDQWRDQLGALMDDRARLATLRAGAGAAAAGFDGAALAARYLALFASLVDAPASTAP